MISEFSEYGTRTQDTRSQREYPSARKNVGGAKSQENSLAPPPPQKGATSAAKNSRNQLYALTNCQEAKASLDVFTDYDNDSEAARAGGKVCLIGLVLSEMTLPLTSAAAREVDVIGIVRYRNTQAFCIVLLRTREIDVKPLITHRYNLLKREWKKPFETSSRGGNVIKVIFNL
ncbi:L-idonate 5-dehydrogenase-like [Capsicum annuum]|uniref:L-idonate 5-dehydrogenase-like n=1 Tax=Capsicum annuum TaxID=4072 RepID=UPI001FB10D5F|nr:L-idonate 5-dehydrogenase-like [Capsicum annuum]